MSLPTSRHLRRVAVALAAATAVVLGPTACDIGLGVPDAAGQPSGSGAGTPAVAAVAVVSPQDPDADETAAAAEADDETAPEETTAADETADDADATDDTDAGDAEETPAEDADGGDDAEGDAAGVDATEDAAAPTTTAPPAAPPVANNGLEVLGTDCSNSDLEPHTGFQEAPRCVQSSHGEVASADNSPSLLITDFPATIGAGEAFDIQVSTRNLVRDRFLGAAAGGYYLESSFLNAEGIQRGHFHTACRILPSEAEAPDAAPVPEFFLATQDNGGGSEADQVVVPVTGLDEPGTYQCSVWAGDGSHRTPLMQRANQTPAFDSVRITVN
jgi:hypothetical protein